MVSVLLRRRSARGHLDWPADAATRKGVRWGLMPIERRSQVTDDHLMARSPSILASSATVARGPDAAVAPAAMRNEQSLDSLAERLAEVAQALRRASQSSDVNDLATFGASISSALGDLAVAAELTANAVIDADRPA